MSLPYDVVLSFAGEDRAYVDAVAAALQHRGIRFFYDVNEEVDLWGKDLYQHLSDVYRNRGRYCVIFASRHYAAKLWPRHELAAAQARAFSENREYILTARFDDTDIPGILPTTGYMDLRRKSPDELADAIQRKVHPQPPQPHVPPAVIAQHTACASEPPRRFQRRAGEPARPWNDPFVADHERLARGTVTDITQQLVAQPSIEVLLRETDILLLTRGAANYYFQCERTYPNLTGFFYWDGSDTVKGVGNPDGSMWEDSDFQIGFFALEHGRDRGDTACVRITGKYEQMSGRFGQVFHQKSGGA